MALTGIAVNNILQKLDLPEVRHTLGHRKCPACEQDRLVQMFPLLPSMLFKEAAQNFMNGIEAPVPHDKARYKSHRTVRDYRLKIKALDKFFGDLRLDEIHLGQFRAYQKARLLNSLQVGNAIEQPWAHQAGTRKTNAELGLLERLMRLAGCWSPELEKYYHRLIEEESEIPRALEPSEQEYFLEIAQSNPEWHIVHWYSLLALHTGFSTDELRTIRQGDINLRFQILAVNRRVGKNKFRRREIPITDSRCMWALERLLERSHTLVGKSPEFYLFPFRVVRNHFEGLHHMSETGVRKQFEAVRDAAGLPWFQLNGWRHTAMTRMAEAGVPMATIMARAGHCSPKMSMHYIHISMQAERLAMQSMNRAHKSGPISIEAQRTRKAMAGY
jgi:integrase